MTNHTLMDDDDGSSITHTCFSVGMSGRCGVECPVLKDGDCKNFQEIGVEAIIKFYDQEEAQEILDNYPQVEIAP
jgi:hypothetical protein